MTPGNTRLQLNCKTYHMSGWRGGARCWHLVTRYMLMWGWKGALLLAGPASDMWDYSLTARDYDGALDTANVAHTTALIVSPATEPGQLQSQASYNTLFWFTKTCYTQIQGLEASVHLFKDRAQPSLLLLQWHKQSTHCSAWLVSDSFKLWLVLSASRWCHG